MFVKFTNIRHVRQVDEHSFKFAKFTHSVKFVKLTNLRERGELSTWPNLVERGELVTGVIHSVGERGEQGELVTEVTN